MESFTLICKPEQSGKTFVMIHEIIEAFKNKKENERIINIILCDNSLLLNNQTKKRLDYDLNTLIFKGTKYIELSSGKNAECKKIEEVFTKIIYNNINNIIMCTNSVRIDDIVNIITMIYSIKDKYIDDFKFNIWIDESDKYISYLENTFIPLCNKFNNNENKEYIKLWGITATPDKLFKNYNSLQVYPIEDTTSINYHGWNDNNISIYDKSPIYNFIKDILKSNKSLIKNNTKWFIPGKNTKKSHEYIAKICINFKMAVIIVNGDGIKLILPNQKVKLYLKNDEFNKKIIDIYDENKLYQYPLAITGYVCISRGISIMSNDFIFDYAILCHFTNNSEASQLAGRLKGNIKHLSNYKIPIVFTTNKFNKAAIEMENKSVELGKVAALKVDEGFQSVISLEEYKNISSNNVKTIPILINVSEEEFNILTKKNGNNYNDNLILNFIQTMKGNILNGYMKDQISMPSTDKESYTKNIVELTKAYHDNKKYSIAIKSKNKRKNVYQIWFDSINYNIIISLYNGSNNNILPINI